MSVVVHPAFVAKLNEIVSLFWGGGFKLLDGKMFYFNEHGALIPSSRFRKDNKLRLINREIQMSGVVLTSHDGQDDFTVSKVDLSQSKPLKASSPYVHSFLKWPGGKGRVLQFILPHFPITSIRLIEPFVGSGIVGINSECKELVINDINKDLMNTYVLIQKMPEYLIRECAELFVAENNTEEAYYRLRREFNSTKDKCRKSVLFIYLNKHGYNGMCRYNSKGEYNIPYGRYKEVAFNGEAILNFHRILVSTGAVIKNDDFRSIMAMAQRGDVVYCDPPYLPLSDTASFTAYHTDGFSEKDHEDLARLAEGASERGATVIISNHDVPLARSLYKNASQPIVEIQVRRSLSCKGADRKKVGELLAVYTGK